MTNKDELQKRVTEKMRQAEQQAEQDENNIGVEFSQEEAEFVGAFVEDAINEKQEKEEV